MRAFVNSPNAWRPPYAPTTLPVRPLRRRMGHPRTAAQPGRKARSTAQVACTPDRGRRLDAVFYLLRSGCSWRMLPKEYPPWQRVYYHFRRWRIDGRLRRAHDRLREESRRTQAPHPSGYQWAGVGCEGSWCRPPRPGRRKAVGERGVGAAETGAALGRRSVHGWIPRVVRAPVWVARGGTTPPRPAVVALRVRGEAARLSTVTSPLGCGAHLRLAWSAATSEQGLRKVARDRRGYDLRRDEPDHAAQAGAGGVKHLHLPGAPDPGLQNSLSETVLQT